jgi:hypothetical protein
MWRVGSDPAVVRLARALGIRGNGDCVLRLRAHALERVRAVLKTWRVSSLTELQLLMANALSVCLEYLRTDEEVEEIARVHAGFSPHLLQTLSAEFVRGDTEGLLLANPCPQLGDLRYLAVIDSRGARAARAYFTAWHELAHLLLSPPQLSFEGFRRSPPPEAKKKDAVESVVDDVAGLIGFYEPMFRPALEAAVHEDGGRLTLGGVDRLRTRSAPQASFYSTALAAIRVSNEPIGLICAKPFWKKDELPWEEGGIRLPSLRVVSAIWSESARKQPPQIRPNMRVPLASVLYRAFGDDLVSELDAIEDQSMWETSTAGPLAPRPVRITAARRGPVAYALVTPLASPAQEKKHTVACFG